MAGTIQGLISPATNMWWLLANMENLMVRMVKAMVKELLGAPYRSIVGSSLGSGRVSARKRVEMAVQQSLDRGILLVAMASSVV